MDRLTSRHGCLKIASGRRRTIVGKKDCRACGSLLHPLLQRIPKTSWCTQTHVRLAIRTPLDTFARILKADGTVRTSDIVPSSTGIEFIKSITDMVEQGILNTMTVGDTLYRDGQEKDSGDVPMGRGRSGDR